MDMIGSKGLLQAWTDVLNGREAQLPTFIGFTEDPLASVGAQKPERQALADDFELKGFKLLKFLAGALYEDNFRGKVKDVNVCLPDRMVSVYKEHAMREIKAAHGENAWISENDILGALVLKASLGDLSSKRPVGFLSVLR
jgi:hypothetical protein